jgi:putative phosphoribosyl transferase
VFVEEEQGGAMSQAVRTETRNFQIQIRSGDVILPGELILPAGAQGVVLFAHGSGSGRHSPRNQFVARTIRF